MEEKKENKRGEFPSTDPLGKYSRPQDNVDGEWEERERFGKRIKRVLKKKNA